MDITCQNCAHLITGNYCSNCGRIGELEKIDRQYAIQEFLNLIGFEKGFLFTCKELLVRPGQVIQEYISKNRQKITRPVTFLVLTSVIYTLISRYLKTDINYNEVSEEMYVNSSVFDIMSWVQDNYGYANLIMILPITWWTILLFKKYNYNFYETFVVISFVMGVGMLIFSLVPILDSISPDTRAINESIVSVLAFLYMSWAIGQFYEKKIKNYFKAFLAYLSGMVTFQILAMGAGIIYDIVTKK